MIGFLIGTACLIGLIKVIRHQRRAYGWRGMGWGGYGHGGYGRCGGGSCSRGRWDRFGGYRDHDDEGFDGPPWARGFDRAPFFLHAIFRQLDATPGQEKVIKAAVEEVRAAAKDMKSELRTSRGDLGKALRAESFDEVLFGEMFGRHDAAMDGFRKTVMGAFAKVHAALDEKQRAKLAELVENGPRIFREGFRGGPWSRRGEDYV